MRSKPQKITRTCCHPECQEEAAYSAPKTPSHSDIPLIHQDRLWFCLPHVREYNRRWNFFAGMSEEEMLQFQEEAPTGHRKTRPIGIHEGAHFWKLGEQAYDFAWKLRGNTSNDTSARSQKKAPADTEREAMSVLNLTYPVTIDEIKQRYRTLVKRYHPDKNAGNKQAEERFKTICHAYNTLLDCGHFTA